MDTNYEYVAFVCLYDEPELVLSFVLGQCASYNLVLRRTPEKNRPTSASMEGVKVEYWTYGATPVYLRSVRWGQGEVRLVTSWATYVLVTSDLAKSDLDQAKQMLQRMNVDDVFEMYDDAA